MMKPLGMICGIWMACAAPAGAAISSGWFDSAVGKIGQEGVSALQLTISEGLILSRLRPDYAAFTFGERRLSQTERKSDPIDVSEFDFVLEYETCGGSGGVLDGRIFVARYRFQTDDAARLAEEILDISAFFHRIAQTSAEVVEANEDRLMTRYRLGVGKIQDVDFTFTLTRASQHITLEARAPGVCPP